MRSELLARLAVIISQGGIYNVFDVFLLLPQGRDGEAWKTSKLYIPFVLPAKQKSLSLLSCLLLSYSLMLCVTTPTLTATANPSLATSWIAGPSQRRIPLEFVLDKVALVLILLRAFLFSCKYYSTNAHLNLQRCCYKKGKQAKSERTFHKKLVLLHKQERIGKENDFCCVFIKD